MRKSAPFFLKLWKCEWYFEVKENWSRRRHLIKKDLNRILIPFLKKLSCMVHHWVNLVVQSFREKIWVSLKFFCYCLKNSNLWLGLKRTERHYQFLCKRMVILNIMRLILGSKLLSFFCMFFNIRDRFSSLDSRQIIICIW